MQIKKKYRNMLMFASLFDKFNDGNEIVEITENDSEYRALTDFNENNTVDSLQEFVDKYDFDGDGKVSIIDMWIPTWIWTGNIKSTDPKYDAINKTYNGKSLDIDNDNTVDTFDSHKIQSSIKLKMNQYFGGTINFDYQDQLNDIKSYYSNNNYTWPTLEQIAYFEKNGTWE